jgi:inorganic pyrophosphatase
MFNLNYEGGFYANTAVRIPHFVHTNLPSGTADEINVVIEVPKGSSIKYDLDSETSAVFVDRRLFTTMV